MITLVPFDSLPKIGVEQWLLPPDRPVQQRDIRKLIFFFFREGPVQTLAKVLARLQKQKKVDSSMIAFRSNQLNAISYDGGKSFYISDVARSTWSSPFAYDSLGDMKELRSHKPSLETENNLYFVGYGNYVQTYASLLRRFCHPRMFVDYNPTIIDAFKAKFDYASHSFSDLQAVWKTENSPVAVLASYHSDHAPQAYALWQAKPESFIFVEKPPLVDQKDIGLFKEMYSAGANIQIGFNRRYAPLVEKVKEGLADGQPILINISVNEVKIADNHWYFWPNQGTRITGNACHWIDICQYFINKKPVKISLTSSIVSPDDCVLVISYEEGSLAVISLCDKGNDMRGVQETIEIKQANSTFRLDDMLRLTVDKPGRMRKTYRRLIRDKGHKRMYQAFARDIKNGTVSNQYPLADLEVVCKLTFEFSRMLIDGTSEKAINVGDTI